MRSVTSVISWRQKRQRYRAGHL